MSKNIRFSILQKQTILVMILVLLSIGCYAYYAITSFRSDKLKYIYQTNQFVNNNLGKTLQTDFNDLQRDIIQIENLVRVKAIDNQTAELITMVFKRNRNLVSFGMKKDSDLMSDPEKPPFTFFIVNKTYLSSNNLESADISKFAYEVLLQGIDKHSEGDLAFRDQTRRQMMSYTSKVGDLVITFLISKEFLFKTLSDAEGHDVFVVDGQNKALAANNVAENGADLSEHPLVEYAKSIQFETASKDFSIPIDGTQRAFVGSFFKVIPGVTLLSQVTVQKASSGLQELMLRTIFFALIVGGVGISLGWLFSKTVTAPLLTLMKATEDLAAGNYQLNFTIKTNDEVEELGNHFLALAQRLNDREKELEKTTELAIKDGMTGAFNNRHFRQKFTEWFADAQTNHKELSFMLIDVDHFKKFNDTYGHQQGDEVLKQLVGIMKATVRETDMVARYGGEEFVVLMPNTNLAEGHAVAEAVRAAYEKHDIPNINGGGIIKSTCSIGVASIRNAPYKTIDEMIEAADQNLYKCKKGGRNRVIS